MDTRRNFLRKTLGALTLMGAAFTPILSGLRWAWAQTRKTILPRGTRRETLIQKNPADLDTRNLEITPLKEFGTMGLSGHAVNITTWRLSVDGHVGKPLKLAYEQMIELPAIERDVLLICPGFFANYGRWKGISMKDLLKKAGIKEGATHVTFRGPEAPYEKVERFPIAEALSEKIFPAYFANGQALPVEHGFPLRLVAEGYYGFDWIKYVYRITVEKIAPST